MDEQSGKSKEISEGIGKSEIEKLVPE